MAQYNYAAAQRRAHKRISKWGGRGVLRRTDLGDREIVIGVIDYAPRNQDLRSQGVRRAVISALDTTGALVTPPPDFELDKVVWSDAVHRITEPVKGIRPDGTAIFYEVTMMYDGQDGS